MYKLAVSVGAFAALITTQTLAADMPVKAPTAVVAQTWTGFYIGGEIGYRSDRTDWTTTSLEGGAIPPLAPGPANVVTFNPNAFRGGLYLGYNWQVSPLWVVGVEGDWTLGNKTASQVSIPGTVGTGGFGGFPTGTADSAGVRDKWDAGIRARLGALISPNLLVFGTAGISWLGQEAFASCGAAGFPFSWCGNAANIGTTQTFSRTSAGWELGGGVEWMMLAKWLLRAEYRHVQYGSWNSAFFTGGLIPGLDTVNATFKTKTDTVLVGLAYKLN
jgi:outer membrane immunogenic protein